MIEQIIMCSFALLGTIIFTVLMMIIRDIHIIMKEAKTNEKEK